MYSDNKEINVLGAIKIKDGLFIGDEFAAKDYDFINTNKVTRIINAAGSQIPNLWESLGIQYLTFNWVESDNQILFDTKNEVIIAIYEFIEESHVEGESVLVHSVRGQSRSCCVLVAFFMMKYKWTLYKTLEFLNSRRPDLEIRASFFQQLTELEKVMQNNGIGAKYSKWDSGDQNKDPEENLLRNTYINAKSGPIAEYWLNQNGNKQASPKKKLAPKINWADDYDENMLTTNLSPSNMRTKTLKRKKILRISSILKGSNKQFNFEMQLTDISNKDYNNNSCKGISTAILSEPDQERRQKQTNHSRLNYSQDFNKDMDEKPIIKTSSSFRIDNEQEFDYVDHNYSNYTNNSKPPKVIKQLGLISQKNQITTYNNFVTPSKEVFNEIKLNEMKTQQTVSDNKKNTFKLKNQSDQYSNQNSEKEMEAKHNQNKLLYKCNNYHNEGIYAKALMRNTCIKRIDLRTSKMEQQKQDVASFQEEVNQEQTQYQKKQLMLRQRKTPLRANQEIVANDRPSSANVSLVKNNVQTNNPYNFFSTQKFEFFEKQKPANQNVQKSYISRNFSPGIKKIQENKNKQKSQAAQVYQSTTSNKTKKIVLRYPSPQVSNNYATHINYF